MGTYADFFVEYGNISPLGLLTLYLLVLMRIGPVVNQASFFGAKIAPVVVRAGLALALSLIVVPLVMMNTPYELKFDGYFIVIAMKEIAVGVIFGFLATVPFLIVQSTGILIDYLRGASILQSQDPTMQNQASPIGILYNYVLIFVFYMINGPLLFFDAVVRSYSVLPVDGFLAPSFFHESLPFWQLATNLMNRMMALSIQFAAPSLVAILMAEMFLGIANRMAPNVQIAFLGMSIKSLLGIALLWFSWFFVLQVISNFSLDWIEQINGVLDSLLFFAQKKTM